MATIVMPGFRSGKIDHHVQRLAICRPLDHPNREPVHLPVDSTGLKLRGPGEWMVDKHGTRTRRSRQKLHLGVDADSGEIMAVGLTAMARRRALCSTK